MQKYRPPLPSGVAWSLGAAMLVALGWALFSVATTSPKSMMIGVTMIAAIVVGVALEAKRVARRLRATASQRNGQSICEFARDFERSSADTWIVRAVYEQLQHQLAHAHPEFPVRADDRLQEDLLLDDDDLDMDVALQVEQRTGRSLDKAEQNPLFGRVRTARDLVMFFQAQPRRDSAI